MKASLWGTGMVLRTKTAEAWDGHVPAVSIYKGRRRIVIGAGSADIRRIRQGDGTSLALFAPRQVWPDGNGKVAGQQARGLRLLGWYLRPDGGGDRMPCLQQAFRHEPCRRFRPLQMSAATIDGGRQ